MKARLVIAGVLTLVVGAAGCTRTSDAATPSPARYPAEARFRSAGGSTSMLHVAVARSDAEKQRGLMGVRSLPDDAGMAFVWTEPTDSAFWMKDTRIPLSIAFASRDGRIETIREMTPCAGDPCPLYRSSGPFVLVIEANAGWYDAHGVRVGDHVTLEDTG